VVRGRNDNETARTIDIPLSFLGATKFTADTWQDGRHAHRHCVRPSPMLCSGNDVLTLKLRQAAARRRAFRPVRSVKP